MFTTLYKEIKIQETNEKGDDMSNSVMIIGIAGGTGSGKSTFTNRLRDAFPDDVAVLYHDNYYKCQDDVPFEERKKVNYDHPDSLETDLMIQHLEALKNGIAVDCPVYDYSMHNRSDKTIHIEPKKIILAEGIPVSYTHLTLPTISKV